MPKEIDKMTALGTVCMCHKHHYQLLYRYSCMGISCAKLFEAAKTHVQIIRIHMLFEHGFYLTKPKLGPDLFA